jgi:hypothetical protein
MEHSEKVLERKRQRDDVPIRDMRVDRVEKQELELTRNNYQNSKDLDKMIIRC